MELGTAPKALSRAGPALASLGGQAKTIPNQGIPIDTLALQEARASSGVEGIHPVPDGDGRIGRIPNVLHLTRAGLLDIPVPCPSRHVARDRADRCRPLQAVRDDGAWEAWALHMLQGVADASATTPRLGKGIRDRVAGARHQMRRPPPRLHGQEPPNTPFRHPCTRIECVRRDLDLKARRTAAKDLDALARHGLVEKHAAGRSRHHVSAALARLFLDASGER